jgi:hypothetical protein
VLGANEDPTPRVLPFLAHSFPVMVGVLLKFTVRVEGLLIAMPPAAVFCTVPPFIAYNSLLLLPLKVAKWIVLWFVPADVRSALSDTVILPRELLRIALPVVALTVPPLIFIAP